MHGIIQCTELQRQPDLAAVIPTGLDNLKAAVVALINSLEAGTRAAVVALIKSLVAGPRAAAAEVIIQPPVPAALDSL